MKILEGYDISPFYLIDVERHQEVKPIILEQIKSTGIHSMVDDTQHISNSDWQLPSMMPRNYEETVLPIMNEVCRLVTDVWGLQDLLRIRNYWFQQYSKDDYHGWHVHPECLFSCVYYLDLDGINPKTTFKLHGKEVEIEVNEGQILVFPAFIPHTSKINTSDKPKTVVVFNIT